MFTDCPKVSSFPQSIQPFFRKIILMVGFVIYERENKQGEKRSHNDRQAEICGLLTAFDDSVGHLLVPDKKN